MENMAGGRSSKRKARPPQKPGEEQAAPADDLSKKQKQTRNAATAAVADGTRLPLSESDEGDEGEQRPLDGEEATRSRSVSPAANARASPGSGSGSAGAGAGAGGSGSGSGSDSDSDSDSDGDGDGDGGAKAQVCVSKVPNDTVKNQQMDIIFQCGLGLQAQKTTSKEQLCVLMDQDYKSRVRIYLPSALSKCTQNVGASY